MQTEIANIHHQFEMGDAHAKEIEFSLKDGVTPDEAWDKFDALRSTFLAPMTESERHQYELFLDGKGKKEGPLGKFADIFTNGKEVMDKIRVESFDRAQTLDEAGVSVEEKVAVYASLECMANDLLGEEMFTPKQQEAVREFKLKLQKTEDKVIDTWLETTDVDNDSPLLSVKQRRVARIVGASLSAALFLAACNNGGGEVTSTRVATEFAKSETPIVETATPEATKTNTPEPTPTKEALPARWDDPEMLADVLADFEAVTGMSVEDYYNKAVEDGLVSVGESNVSIGVGYGLNILNGIGLGTRAVETGDGARHLVVYFARRSGDGVGVYPLDVAVERNGVFAQTSLGKMDDIAQSVNIRTNPIHFSSVEGGVEQLDRLVMGSKVYTPILVAFRSLDECDAPQNPYTPQMDEGYWAYAQGQCRTEGTYLNVGSQEPLTVREGGVEYSGTYNIDAIMARSGPAAGLVVSHLGFFTLD